MSQTVGIQEITSALKVSRMTVMRRSRSQKWRKLRASHSRGGKKFYFHFDALPEDVRLKLIAHRNEVVTTSNTIDPNSQKPSLIRQIGRSILAVFAGMSQ